MGEDVPELKQHTETYSAAWTNRYCLLLLCCTGLILSMSIYLACTRGLTETLEAESAEIAREFTEGASLLINHLNGREDLDKPPLFYWAIALFSYITPSWKLAARLPSLLSALLILFLFYRISRYYCSYQPLQDIGMQAHPMAPVLAGFIFISSPKVFWMSQVARMDMSLTAACFLAICSFYKYVGTKGQEAGHRDPPFTFFIAAACSVMIKGPVGAILIFIPAAIYLASEQEWPLIRKIFLGKGMVLFLILTVPWFVTATLATDFRFFHRFILEENISRFTSLIPKASCKEFNYSPIYLYPVYFLTGFFPWSLAAPVWTYSIIKSWKEQDHLSKLLLIYSLFIFIFFSIAMGKRSDYILPLYPAAAFLTARYLMHGVNAWKIMKFLSVLTFVLLSSAGAAAACLCYAIKYARPETLSSIFPAMAGSASGTWLMQTAPSFLPGLVVLAVIASSGAWISLRHDERTGLEYQLVSHALHITAVFILAGIVILPPIYRQKDASHFCMDISGITAGEPLYYYGFWDEQCTFYLHRQIDKLPRSELQKMLRNEEKACIIMQERKFKKLKQDGISFPFSFTGHSPALTPLVLVCTKQVQKAYKRQAPAIKTLHIFLDTDEHRNTEIFFVFYLRTKSVFICVLSLASAPTCKQIQKDLHELIEKLFVDELHN